MTIVYDLDDDLHDAAGAALSIGNFDGVHRGHAALLSRLRELANEVAGPAVVLTFHPHPASILRPDRAPQPLTTIDRRIELLGKLGVERVVVCRPTRQILNLTADQFFLQILRDRLQCRGVVEGPNFCFGKDRQGDIDVLARFCDDAGMQLRVVAAELEGNEMVSSTAIRTMIASGDIESANAMLTAPYRICGNIVAGAGRGATIGFPTANLDQISVMRPGNGVYSGQCVIGPHTYRVAVHVGPNPTFDEGQSKVEVHVLDFHGDLYGKTLEVDLHHRIRNVIKYDSVDALLSQLAKDISTIRQQPLDAL